MTALGVLLSWTVGLTLVALWIERRRRRRMMLMPVMSMRVHIPDGWDLLGVTLVDDDGQTQFINLEDPVAAAERVTRESS